MSQLLDLLTSLTSCLPCLPSSPTLKINSRSLKILRLLGEGGFSYVYLVQSLSSPHELYALKKIRCPFGAESVSLAMKEVEAYKIFGSTPGIIHSVDYSIATERGGGEESKTVYVLLPYYKRGNLQDMINANLVNHSRFPEKKLMGLFLGVCRALRGMHVYEGSTEGEGMVVPGQGKRSGNGVNRGADQDDEQEQGRSLLTEDERVAQARATGGKRRSYAHRDIKPGNIMISDSGSDPILMDLGSVAESPLPITSRSLAIATQDTAAEHSTMPYRAPELFDVKTGTVIDTKVDIWSMGCTLYACLVGKSPFEMRSDETGGSLSICVLSGDWRFPDEGPGAKKKKNKGKGTGPGPAEGGAAQAEEEEGVISEPIREVVRRCLRVEPSERPDIDELIEMVEQVLEVLPEDEV
ncbi:putative serine/threonine-protein kinase [Triangularia verruculosa]|uniref:non-specific serine/threonine protein kinase n=1 Tax=Triangularia verruculosa TaxID=2587418 RepID=A0AAN6XTM6_9PEZI|nr:putative serine/threonine-protein kinase [Triangularia verruculosa]